MNFLFVGTPYQLKFTPAIKAMAGTGNRMVIKNSATKYITQISDTIRKANTQHGMQIHGIVLSDVELIKKYVAKEYGVSVARGKAEATQKAYAGSMFSHEMTTSTGTKYQIPVVCAPIPDSLSYSKATQFVYQRMVSKLYDKSWNTAPKMDWVVATETNIAELYSMMADPVVQLISIDIETRLSEIPFEMGELSQIDGIPTKGMWYLGQALTKAGAKSKSRLAYMMPIITCTGYTAISRNHETGALSSFTVVIPMISEQMRRWTGKFNLLSAPKVMHNGRYDATYFLRYDIPVHNWVFDTLGLMHGWYIELPRDLGFTTSMFVRNYMYWKDESGSNLYEYNAKDCHATAWACIFMLADYPDFARDNYVGIFKQVFPCITCGLEGFAEDAEESKILWEKYQQRLRDDQAWWDKVITPNFNVGSAPQVKKLFQSVMNTGIKDTAAPTLKGIKHKHPLWRLMIDKLLDTREAKKADSTYMNVTLFAERTLYELDPFGTDSGRYASKSSSFWCGTQIQNQPEYAKSKFIADPGYELSAIDNSQAESRTTAYITGDMHLIDAVENSKDFHVRNASRFFGMDEDALWELEIADPERFAAIRNKIGKKLNHGANYYMMENVLISTMTPDNIILAKHALKLPGSYTFKQVARYLLDCFEQAYPLIRSLEPGGYLYGLIEEVREAGKLLSPDGFTRLTFLQPEDNKKHLNQLVAHKPQGWAVRIINKSFYDVWLEMQIGRGIMRLKAQIHDEIMYQTKPEHTKIVTDWLSNRMKQPNKIGDTGKTMVIPNKPVVGHQSWGTMNH